MILYQRITLTAGILLILSGCTHLTQLVVYQHHGHVIAASLFGLAYLVIGILLVIEKQWVLWIATLLPLIGGILGVIRFIYMHTNPFSFFHVLLDMVIVPFCLYVLVRKKDMGR
ncbi:MAG: hypothetical protein GYA16_03590 [Spirochaetes bacterium]|nr:hypothetical protein [Spirochaetota bacterium]NMB63931.1 hypothetical protein [Spirochaetota bacterium]HOJ30099.1 hypothetical protein [Spirochaetota bacterium]HOM11002.1 hypothetical protein [Spirochaetota bacterium]HPP51060.1 hypothetical protein [Spirochaetota bacterium]